jgi:hypothetical protein
MMSETKPAKKSTKKSVEKEKVEVKVKVVKKKIYLGKCPKTGEKLFAEI